MKCDETTDAKEAKNIDVMRMIIIKGGTFGPVDGHSLLHTLPRNRLLQSRCSCGTVWRNRVGLHLCKILLVSLNDSTRVVRMDGISDWVCVIPSHLSWPTIGYSGCAADIYWEFISIQTDDK